MKALIDTNIIIDVLTNREPFAERADRIISSCANGRIDGFIAAHTITNLFYILRKAYTADERRTLLKLICSILQVAPVDSEVLTAALEDTSFSDFEDCVQYHCALAQGCDCIITRNIGDYTASAIPVMTPEDVENS